MDNDIKDKILWLIIGALIGALITNVIVPIAKSFIKNLKYIVRICFQKIIETRSNIKIIKDEKKNPYSKRISNYKKDLSYDDYKILCKKKKQGILSSIEKEAYNHWHSDPKILVEMMQESVQGEQDRMKEMVSYRKYK